MIDHIQYRTRYDSLNPEQKLAVDTIEGPAMVVAGPGTGKTELLALRIVNILQRTKTRPEEILALTFTDSGVQAMRDRLRELIGTDAYKVNIFSFHAFCNQVIRDNPEAFAFHKELEPLTDIEKMKLLRSLIDSFPNGAQLKPFGDTYLYMKDLEKAFKTLKQEDRSPQEFKDLVLAQRKALDELPDEERLSSRGPTKGKPKQEFLRRIKSAEKLIELADAYAHYQKELRTKGRYDFEDMIFFVVRKFENDPAFRESYSERYRYFLVDEYQDTNTSQNKVVTMLAEGEKNPNIFVVGDDDQAIYRFQGASLKNIHSFHTQYPQMKVIVLKKNYRSTQSIINASTELIRHSEKRLSDLIPGIDKRFESGKGIAGTKVKIAHLSSIEAEYFYVLKKIKELAAKKVPLKDIAVFYRDNKDSQRLADLLKKEHILFNVSIDADALQNHYVKKLLYFLGTVNSAGQNASFFKYLCGNILTTDNEDIYTLTRYAHERKDAHEKSALFDILGDAAALKELDLKNEKELTAARTAILELRRDRQDLPLGDLVVRALHRSNIIKALTLKEDNLFDLNQVNSFVKWVRAQSDNDPHYDLDQLLTDIDLMNEVGLIVPTQELYSAQEGVNLMTAHKSKGLQFPYVFILQCTAKKWEAKTVPDKLKLPEGLLGDTGEAPEKEDKVEDSRRLFYVAMTRAKEELYLTCHTRDEDGDEKLSSAFLSELAPEQWEKEDTEALEQQEAERMLLELAEPPLGWKKEASRGQLEQLVHRLIISPTSLNNYLKCPLYFKLNTLYRVPGEFNKHSALGTCVHGTLEEVFSSAAGTGTVPPVAEWERIYLREAERMALPEKEKEEIMSEGLRYLKGYYEHYKDTFHTKCLTEYDFHDRGVEFEGIPITGMLDKVELLPGGIANVIDYKTGKPRSKNDILGLTATQDRDYHRQLVFYKLLCENDKNAEFKMVKGVIDFIKPNANDTYSRVEFEIPDEDLNTLKDELRDAYKKIQELKFDPLPNNDRCTDMCDLWDICQGGN